MNADRKFFRYNKDISFEHVQSIFPLLYMIGFLLFYHRHEAYYIVLDGYAYELSSYTICSYSFKYFSKALFYHFVLGGTVSIPGDSVFLRRRPVKDMLEQFVKSCRIKFCGISRILIPNTRGVLHPIDFFVKDLFELYNPDGALDSFETYKRTNPTLALRLNELEKFSMDRVIEKDVINKLNEVSDSIFSEIVSSRFFNELKDNIFTSVQGNFKELTIDGSSAAGYPYPSGTKRHDVYDECIKLSSQLLQDDWHFSTYMKEHLWYTTGRAKLQERSKDPAARLICYGGFASMLISMLYLQVFARYMNTTCEWCAVGMSWMNGGAEKFVKYFGDTKGNALEGYRYITIDIKGWDSGLSSILLNCCLDFHVKLMISCNVPKSYIDRFKVIFEDMIKARLLFPLGYFFQAVRGMKSGWSSTANDNTLIHEMVFRYVEQTVGVRLRHKLYGDDNFVLVPDSIKTEHIIKAYRDCGVIVGKCVESKRLEDVDFLSKQIKYFNGEYFIYRDEVETFSRLLMPEEMDPSRRIISDARIAAERLIGHLFDNPFNAKVRRTIYDMLTHLRDHYQITHITLDPETLKKPPWRFMDPNRLIGKIPVIPEFSFIKELYGVRGQLLDISWPPNIPVVSFDYSRRDNSSLRFFSAQNYYRDMWRELLRLERRKRKVAVKKTSPFVVPFSVKGFHGARFESAVTYFNIQFETMLDFGSHPGAAAYSAAKDKSRKVTCVSLVPEGDRRQFPYVLRKNNVKFIIEDVEKYRVDSNYDLLHDDVDIVGARTDFTNFELAEKCLLRFQRDSKYVKQSLGTLHEISPNTIEMIYDTYRKYGAFDIFKPPYSNPWKPEFMVYFKHSGEPLIKKRVFISSLYSYLNSHASSIIRWSDVMLYNIDRLNNGVDPEICPYQGSEARLQHEKLLF